jgi:hypothetical protein
VRAKTLIFEGENSPYMDELDTFDMWVEQAMGKALDLILRFVVIDVRRK